MPTLQLTVQEAAHVVAALKNTAKDLRRGATSAARQARLNPTLNTPEAAREIIEMNRMARRMETLAVNLLGGRDL